MQPSFDRLREPLTEILLTTPEERMYADVLDLMLEAFESEFGYFGYIDSKGDLVCPSMTRRIFAACQVPDKDVVFERAIWGGLWGRILTEKRALKKNAAHGVPEGHLPIQRSFGAPILYRGVLIGQIHLANRDRDYETADVDVLREICAFLAPVLNARLRRDEEERRRVELEEDLRSANEELRAKVDELERLRDAMIDREERMVELKARIRALEGEG
ncbi:MAG: GAF domain-containing protein [Myxococcota bacterium]|nr:GAF domain-containing protein [Myxococcota bacterium]